MDGKPSGTGSPEHTDSQVRASVVEWDEGEPFIQVRDGIRLTPLRAEDVDGWCKLRSDPVVLWASNGDPAKTTRQAAERFIVRAVESNRAVFDALKRGDDAKLMDETSPFRVIRSYPDGEILGSLALSTQDEDPPSEPSTRSKKALELGISLAAPARGMGLASQGVSALVQAYAVDTLDLDEVVANVITTNTASRKLLVRCGFTLDRELEVSETPSYLRGSCGKITLYKLDLKGRRSPGSIYQVKAEGVGKVEEEPPSAVKWDVDEPYIPITEGVRLTPMREGDEEAWYDLYTAPDVMKLAYARTAPFTREVAATRVKATIASQIGPVAELKRADVMGSCPLTAIRSHPGGELMGSIGIYPNDDRPLPPLTAAYLAPDTARYPWTTKTYDIGYNKRPDFAGKGYMKATVQALIRGYVVPVMRLAQLGAEVKHDHAASLAILGTNGFGEVSRFTQETVPASGVEPFEAIRLRRIVAPRALAR